MYFVLLLILLASTSTVDRLHNSMTVPSNGLMMDHLQAMLDQGAVSNDNFMMVRRALANPANGPHEEKIHVIINSILKELENAYVAFSTKEIATKQNFVKVRDDTIKESKQNTKKYEDIINKMSTEFSIEQEEMDKELLKLEQQLHEATLSARKERNKLQEKVDEAEQALEDAQLKEETTIKNTELLYENSVKALETKGVSERKTVCGEYGQMKELRNNVHKVDEEFESKNIFTPEQIANLCSTRTCQYTEGYHVGKAFTCSQGTYEKPNFASIVITESGQSECCTSKVEFKFITSGTCEDAGLQTIKSSKTCFAAARTLNYKGNEYEKNDKGSGRPAGCSWHRFGNIEFWTRATGTCDRYDGCFCIEHVKNKYEENAPGIGGWGGYCTCPDGSKYAVGDNFDACGSLACINGQSGECHRRKGEWSNKKVTCAGL